MIAALEHALSAREYDELPEAIKHTMDFRGWAWLSDAEKARLIQDETEPESFEC
jgi:hypothetical protein